MRFLNGQVTNDVTKIPPDAALYAAVINIRAKMDADIFITALPDALIIDADPLVTETLPPRLEKYIIADDVTLENLSGEFRFFHLLTPVPPSLPEGAFFRKSNRFGKDGLDLWFPKHSSPAFEIAPPEIWETIRVENAVPRWNHELTPDIFPPEAGLETTAISYKKGCYIGQEIISRLKSVGHVNKALHTLVAEAEDSALPPLPADLLAGGKKVGTLTSALFSPTRQKVVALAYVNRQYFATSNEKLTTGSIDWILL